MAYTGEISRENPTCILFVIDQSGSIGEQVEGKRSRAQFVADVFNRTLYTLVTRCTEADGVRGYFDVGLIAYGGNGVVSGFGGALSANAVYSIQAISESPVRVEDRSRKIDDGAGGIVEQKIKFPVWFDSTAIGGTPTVAALTEAAEVAAQWCEAHPQSYPPTILRLFVIQPARGCTGRKGSGIGGGTA